MCGARVNYLGSSSEDFHRLSSSCADARARTTAALFVLAALIAAVEDDVPNAVVDALGADENLLEATVTLANFFACQSDFYE